MTTDTFTIGGDLTVHRVGFGAMRLTGPDTYGMPADPEAAKKVVQRAVELGVDFIDTADQYGPFTSEQIVADALHPRSDDVIVATKGGLVRYGPNPALKNDATPQHLREALEGSLRRLKTERIDLYQLHRIDPDIPVEATFTFLRQAQDEGKVRHLGLSEVTVEEIEKAQEFFDVTSVQNRYSIGDRAAEPVLEYCRAQGIAFIPWFPIGGGDMGGHDALSDVSAAHGAGIRQVALAWLLHHADNILLIPGTSSVSHLEENMTARDLDLTAEQMQALDALSPAPLG
ncbi:aldo/keto reductase [Trujillonella endophytica]|uniref:Predicted oxidoreductase n=1 Tax=Trujillonella endophytica TaxID=673521 RepID=A0A1H8QS86_9ACTN|nr:aldo/keto reductase [Trujillella endophytica]SEO56821.1 Predicted oxidoreductase [Trujillella endophytica]